MLTKYRFEIVLGSLLLILFFAISNWQTGDKLSDKEIEHYMSILNRDLPVDVEEREELIARIRYWAEHDDGKPFFMLNLMRYHDALQEFPGAPKSMSPQASNQYYEEVAGDLLIKRGGYPVLAATTMSVSKAKASASNIMLYEEGADDWDRVIVVRYPCRRTLLQLLTDPDYLEVMPYKVAALKVALVPMHKEVMMPDLRLLFAGIFLIIFLCSGWIRSSRR